MDILETDKTDADKTDKGISALEELAAKIASYDPEADLTLVRKAFFFANDAHCNQKRQEGGPYVGHPIAVANILADMQMDIKTIIAGLLHDTIEDTETTLEDVRGIFGPDVAFIVNALTKLKRIEFKNREDEQAENFRKMFLAMSEDARVIMIKFADRLHNMKTLSFLPPPKQKKIAEETLDIYAPLANRLGIGWLKSEFEDLGFRYLHPEIYEELFKRVFQKRGDQEGYIKDAAAKVSARLNAENLPAKVSGRVKNYYGIYQKMQAQRLTFEDVHDVFGLRIITDTKGRCYEILGLIHSIWIPVPGRFKDYIALPKSNMYQSLHTTVLGPQGRRIEFQIRTEEMHLVAEKGIASHWLYKEKEPIKDKDARGISWLRDLVNYQLDTKDAREFLDLVKGEVYPDVVFVFTPAGDIEELPKGSTAVDFAYHIHTEVGNRCAGAKVNGRIVPLRYHLNTGDSVEVITSASHGPSKDWLSFVVTHKAKNRIKHWIKSSQRKQGMELGTKLLEDELRKQGLSPSAIKDEKTLDAARAFNLKNVDNLLMAIGYGKVSARQIVNRLRSGEKPDEPAQPVKPAKTSRTSKAQKGIKITGIDNILYTVAKCCYPVAGDNIVGFITKGKGVSIHRNDCAHLLRNAVDESRLVDVSWSSDEDASCCAKLFVETADAPGMLARLSALISSLEINLSNLTASSSENKHAHFTFTLQIKDKSQLMSLTHKLMSCEGVIRVKR
jgi:GTP pyrophosphokinase